MGDSKLKLVGPTGRELSTEPGQTPAMQRTHALCSAVMPHLDAVRSTLEMFVVQAEMADQQNAKNLLYEADVKLREAWHRVQDLCGASLQSPRAAREASGGE